MDQTGLSYLLLFTATSSISLTHPPDICLIFWHQCLLHDVRILLSPPHFVSFPAFIGQSRGNFSCQTETIWLYSIGYANFIQSGTKRHFETFSLNYFGISVIVNWIPTLFYSVFPFYIRKTRKNWEKSPQKCLCFNPLAKFWKMCSLLT